jgi:hypothetical protein
MKEVSDLWICGCWIKICFRLLPSFPFTWHSVEFIYVRWMEPFLLLNQTHYYFVTDLLKVTNKALFRCCESHAKLERPPKLELLSCGSKHYSAPRSRKRLRGRWGHRGSGTPTHPQKTGFGFGSGAALPTGLVPRIKSIRTQYSAQYPTQLMRWPLCPPHALSTKKHQQKCNQQKIAWSTRKKLADLNLVLQLRIYPHITWDTRAQTALVANLHFLMQSTQY